MSLGVVIIGSEKRRETTFPACLESVRAQAPDQIVVVSEFPVVAKGVRSLVVPPMTRTTNDALVKRDVGWLATTTDHVLFLCDDHALDADFKRVYLAHYAERPDWDILAPSRYCLRDGDRTWLAMGRDHGYVGGHGGIYHRWCSVLMPWAATHHHPNWDVIHTKQLVEMGARLLYAATDLAIVDLIPEDMPWYQTEDQLARHEAWHRSIEGKVL